MCRRLVLVPIALLAVACGDGPAGDLRPPVLTWEPLEEINAALPDEIQLFAGVDTEAPLRAWYVRAQPGAGVQIQVDAAADDDGVETGSEIAERTAARVVLNGGYFRMGEEPMRHVGLLVVNGEIIEPAIDSVLRDGERYYLARGALGFLADGSPDIAWASSRDGVLYEWESPPPNAASAAITELDFDRFS